jgi:hypothetical protein
VRASLVQRVQQRIHQLDKNVKSMWCICYNWVAEYRLEAEGIQAELETVQLALYTILPLDIQPG